MSFPRPLIDRLSHYFTTYKLMPGAPSRVTIDATYGRERAYEVIEAALADYVDEVRRVIDTSALRPD